MPTKPPLPLLHNSILASPADWSSTFFSHLNTSHPRKPSSALPVLVTLNPPPLLQFPLSYHSEAFIANFGKLVRASPSLRILSSSILYALSQKHSLNLSPSSRIERRKFYGAILPSHKSDEEEIHKVKEQAKEGELERSYLAAAERSNLTAIYLATRHFSVLEKEEGQEEEGRIEAFRVRGEIESFTLLAHNRSMTVETVESLLGSTLPSPTLNDKGERAQAERKGAKGFEREWESFQTLTPEQKDVVDYEVLLRSTQFGGSSAGANAGLSWGVALRRHVVASGGAGHFRSISGNGKGGKTGPPAPSYRPGGKERRVERVGRESVVIDVEEELKMKADQGENEKGKGTTTMFVEHSFRDELSVIFGPKGEGEVWVLGGWP